MTQEKQLLLSVEKLPIVCSGIINEISLRYLLFCSINPRIGKGSCDLKAVSESAAIKICDISILTIPGQEQNLGDKFENSVIGPHFGKLIYVIIRKTDYRVIKHIPQPGEGETETFLLVGAIFLYPRLT